MSGKQRGILFDMDGVILATEELKDAAHALTIAEFGGSPVRDLYHTLMGGEQHVVEDAFMRASGLSVSRSEYSEVFRAKYLYLLRNELKPVPGALDLLAQANNHRLRLALVTSSMRWMVEEILAQNDLERLFHTVITADDVQHPKPAPDPYLQALNRLDLAPSRALVVEDTETGKQAGLAAGVRVVALRHEYNGHFEFDQASCILRSLEPADEVIERLVDLMKAA